jgi:hypothetical protein
VLGTAIGTNQTSAVIYIGVNADGMWRPLIRVSAQWHGLVLTSLNETVQLSHC